MRWRRIALLLALPSLLPQSTPEPAGAQGQDAALGHDRSGVQAKAFVAQGPAAFRSRTVAEPHEPNHYLMGSNACALQGDYLCAIDFMETGVSRVPDAPASFLFNLGQLHARVGNWSAARQNFREGLRRDPANPNFMEMLALLEEGSGDLGVAERLYEGAYRYSSESNQRSFRLNRISFLLRTGRLREAASLFRLVAAPPFSPGVVEANVEGGAERVGGGGSECQDWVFGNEFGQINCVHAYMSRWRPPPSGAGRTRIYGKDEHEGNRRGKGGTSIEQGRDRQMEADVITGLRHKIAALQHPADCSKARAVIMKMEHDDMGFAASFHMATLALNFALMTNRTLVMASRDSWYSPLFWRWGRLARRLGAR